MDSLILRLGGQAQKVTAPCATVTSGPCDTPGVVVDEFLLFWWCLVKLCGFQYFQGIGGFHKKCGITTPRQAQKVTATRATVTSGRWDGNHGFREKP